MAGIRIVVADEYEILRQGLQLILEREQDMKVVGEARTGEEAVRVTLEQRPDVLLLEAKLPDLDGPEVCRRVLASLPKTSVLMLTACAQESWVQRSLEAGARGYLLKDVELAELKRVIRSVWRGGCVLDPRVAPLLSEWVAGRRGARCRDTDLTIIRLLSQGRTYKEIGARIRLSPFTVQDHIEKICLLLDVRSRTQVVAEAVRRGWI